MTSFNSLRQSMFLHEQREKRKIRELGDGETMEGNYGACWIISGVHLEKKTEELGFQA
jgi:hypothetical protein